jgi:DNA recombination protein RmuC
MAEVLAAAALALAALTLALTALILVRLARLGREDLSREAIAQILRNEADLIRRHGDDQARGLRQELGDNLKNFQDTTTNAFSTLGSGVGGQVREFGERLDAGIRTIDLRVAGIAEKLNADIAQLGEDAVRAREALRHLVEGKLDGALARQSEEAKGLRSELNDSFHRLGANVATTLSDLGLQQKERLAATTGALEALGEKHERAQEALRQAVESRLDAIRQESATKLEEMRQTVDEKLQSTLETRLGESFNRVVEQLNRVHEGLGEMKNLASNVGDLRNVLTNVKVRGTFGEVQAELLLEQFLAPDQYVKGARVRDNTSERVEFAVRLPGKGGGEELLLPIDAKFPRESYERLLAASDAGDGAAIELHRKQLQLQVRACAKEICEKYVHPPRTTDFAILFLPTEGLYAEVLRQPGIFEGIQRDHKVTLAGPTTLSAILNALQMGFRSLAIERRSSEVWQVLGAVKSEFGKYNGIVEGLSRQLHTAINSVDKLGTRARAMTRTLKAVEAMPDGAAGEKLLGFDGDDEGLPPVPIPADILIPEANA